MLSYQKESVCSVCSTTAFFFFFGSKISFVVSATIDKAAKSKRGPITFEKLIWFQFFLSLIYGNRNQMIFLPSPSSHGLYAFHECDVRGYNGLLNHRCHNVSFRTFHPWYTIQSVLDKHFMEPLLFCYAANLKAYWTQPFPLCSSFIGSLEWTE